MGSAVCGPLWTAPEVEFFANDHSTPAPNGYGFDRDQRGARSRSVLQSGDQPLGARNWSPLLPPEALAGELAERELEILEIVGILAKGFNFPEIGRRSVVICNRK